MCSIYSTFSQLTVIKIPCLWPRPVSAHLHQSPALLPTQRCCTSEQTFISNTNVCVSKWSGCVSLLVFNPLASIPVFSRYYHLSPFLVCPNISKDVLILLVIVSVFFSFWTYSILLKKNVLSMTSKDYMSWILFYVLIDHMTTPSAWKDVLISSRRQSLFSISMASQPHKHEILACYRIQDENWWLTNLHTKSVSPWKTPYIKLHKHPTECLGSFVPFFSTLINLLL